MVRSKLFKELIASININDDVLDSLTLSILNNDCLPSCFKTTELATSSLMVAVCALAEYTDDTLSIDNIAVDNRLASLWFNKSLVPINWELSGVWDSMAGDYPCSDAWIRLHTNASHHKTAALNVLQCEDSKLSVAEALRGWKADELELAIVNAGGCAATMRSLDDWQQHPQGKAVSAEPIVHWQECSVDSFYAHIDTEAGSTGAVGTGAVGTGAVGTGAIKSASSRPLEGVRVLDLTRVLAGPVSTRFLAAYGAEVLRIDPADWEEPGVVPEVTLGKRCAHLDLKTDGDCLHFLALIEKADVLIHGYRPGALSALGLGDDVLRAHNPRLIDVSLNAYGWTGPWSQRRGFDSLVQMSSGIADEGMKQFNSDKPYPLPVQALDHATGYLMAAAALHALAEKRRTGRVLSAKLSLARTAHVLIQYPQSLATDLFNTLQNDDLDPQIEKTTWGDARRVKFPVRIDDVDAHWSSPACALRSSKPEWL